MPAPPAAGARRERALAELLRHRDLVLTRVRGGFQDGATRLYNYEEAFRVVEDRFGGAEYYLLLDHRSFVNVPHLVNFVLPRLPRERIYVGCMMDQSLLGVCSGAEASLCGYLQRRRAPLFAHGMGALVSGDVARFLADLARAAPLRRQDVAADVALGMWLQTLEDLLYESLHEIFHELPGREVPGGEGLDLSQPLGSASSVVWPMTEGVWELFDAATCTLVSQGTEWIPAAAAADEASPAPAPAAPAAAAAAVAKESAIDCWKGLTGRPEAWYMTCCRIGWSGCWGGDFTEERCCSQPPPGFEGPGPPQPAGEARGSEALGAFLGFDARELRLLDAALLEHAGGRRGEDVAAVADPTSRFPCFTPDDCLKEAFARFYQRSWEVGALPLRHPWISTSQDVLFPYGLKLRGENDGWGPKGHEHTFERQQVADWLRRAAEYIQPEDLPGERRCLEWDSTSLSRYFFRRHCGKMDHIAYDGEDAHVVENDKGARRYVVDVHEADKVIPANSVGIVICCQVFEHLRRPHIAMQQLFKFVVPGGFVVWSAPMFSELHGAPEDFYRYTPMGARAVAEDAGFVVVGQYAPGDLRELAGYLVGITAPYWKKEVVLNDVSSSWSLQTYMLLHKPLT